MSDIRTSSKPRTRKTELLVSIGGHAFVDMPNGGNGQDPNPPINDSHGQPLSNDLCDGEEVELLAWNPRFPGGLAYQIRRLGEKQEWWLHARYLRTAKLAEPVATT